MLCRQQTYLPFECESCGHKYCKHHFHQIDHECVNLAKEREAAKQANIDKIKANKKSKVNKPTYKCTHKKCKKREWIKIECKECLKSFCLKHRAPDAHKCDGDKCRTIREKRDKFIKKVLAKETKQSCAKQMAQSTQHKTKPSPSIIVH